VQDGVTGVLARVDDADGLAAGIHRVLTDPTLRDRLVTQGRVRAMDFDASSIGDRYVELLHEVAAPRGPHA
jgi:glycosyltransferase involved in cell wall biosynthesis